MKLDDDTDVLEIDYNQKNSNFLIYKKLKNSIKNSKLKKKIIALNFLNLISIFIFQSIILTFRIIILLKNKEMYSDFKYLGNLQKTLLPLGFYVKETQKYNLWRSGYLTTTNTINDGQYIWNNTLINYFYEDLNSEFGKYHKEIIESSNKFNLIYDQRIYSSNLQMSFNANYLFIFGQCLFDFFNFKNSYNNITNLYNVSIDYWDIVSSYNNFLVISDIEINLENNYANNMIDFEKRYMLYLLIMEIQMVLFIIFLSILMIYIYKFMNSILTNISDLFLKFEKNKLITLKQHYSKTLEKFEFFDKVSIQTFVNKKDNKQLVVSFIKLYNID